MKYKISTELKKAVNCLQLNAVTNNSIKIHRDILTCISVKLKKTDFLTREEVKELRSAIAESVVSPMNITEGLWQDSLNDVFRVLKSCDMAIYNDGDEDIKATYDWED